MPDAGNGGSDDHFGVVLLPLVEESAGAIVEDGSVVDAGGVAVSAGGVIASPEPAVDDAPEESIAPPVEVVAGVSADGDAGAVSVAAGVSVEALSSLLSEQAAKSRSELAAAAVNSAFMELPFRLLVPVISRKTRRNAFRSLGCITLGYETAMFAQTSLADPHPMLNRVLTVTWLGQTEPSEHRGAAAAFGEKPHDPGANRSTATKSHDCAATAVEGSSGTRFCAPPHFRDSTEIMSLRLPIRETLTVPGLETPLNRPFRSAGRWLALGLVAVLAIGGCRSTTLDTEALGLSTFSSSLASGYPVHGIDVSKYQGNIDWDAARDGGVAFAYLKATEGGDRVDDMFLANWKAAGAAGVPRGAYHFWYHCRPGAEQAKWFIQNVPKDRYALPPVIDVEWTPFSPTCTKRPARDDLVREVKAMSDALESYYGKKPILYIPIDVHRDRMVGAMNDHQFWVRAVKDHPENVYESRQFRFWQYTATGTVPGIRGEVDRNVFAGSREDWTKWLKAHIG